MKTSKQLLVLGLFSGLLSSLSAQVVLEKGTSAAVHPGLDGRLVYVADAKGNRLPDFSYVGYHSGEKAIPDVPVQVTLSPVGGDNTASIQNAIDKLAKINPAANGFRGALLLKRGVYRVEGVLRIRQSGIVLRGEGDDPEGTLIIATGYGANKYKRTLITVGNGGKIEVDLDSKQKITDAYVAVGVHDFTVQSTAGYNVGDRIVVFRPSTKKWIASIGCNKLKPKWTPVTDVRWVKDGARSGLYYQRGGISYPQRIAKHSDESWDAFKKRAPISADGKTLDTTTQWQPGRYDFYFERKITAIKGNDIAIDAPIMHAMESAFGGGAIFKYKTPGRVAEVGIENLCLVSEFGKPVEGHPYGSPKETGNSEKHGWHAIKLSRNTENTWVRNVTGNFFGWSVVSASGTRATVQDCVSLGHASKITGGRRYPFMIDGQLNLVQRCVTFAGRHEFVNQEGTAGPNVFVDCIGKNSKNSSGPHHRYSVGNLFDNVKSEKYMESRFRGNSGTGHGWAGTQICFYNCIAPGFAVEAPPGGISWVIGSGKSDEKNIRVAPASLYYQQVQERLGTAALKRLATDEQLKNLGNYLWVKERLNGAK